MEIPRQTKQSGSTTDPASDGKSVKTSGQMVI